MSARPFHLGWFGSFTRVGWNGRWSGSDARSWGNGDWHIDLARNLERACFDYMMFEDSLMVSDIHGGSMNTNLKYGQHGPKNDPMCLLPVLAKATKHIGLISTASATFYPPFMLARTLSTLSHLSEGRTGWNIVTSSEHYAAQNFGMDALPEHDERYDRADEYVALIEALLDSWEPDAMVMDRENNVFVDGDKVHVVNFEGKYYKSRGPLNSLPVLGGRPVFCQAGASPRGRRFAAEHADTVLALVKGVPAMKAYREDVRAKMVEAGRDPDSMKMLFVVTPNLADTLEEALAAKKLRRTKAESMLSSMSALTENDMSQYDLDAPIEAQLETNGHRSSLENFLKAAKGSGKTLRELAEEHSNSCLDLDGTPESVASQMDEVMQEIGGDGFLLTAAWTRRQIADITEGLVPELQRRGLVRTEYTYPDLRSNLFEY
jgi:FMN-dependent oxidoreductase (nitrilotriacetate monooxygenase family)